MLASKLFICLLSGWVPKHVIKDHQHKVYLLDFFGSSSYRGSLQLTSMKTKVLTAFDSPFNTFLGYYIPNTTISSNSNIHKQNQGILWGKDLKHFNNKLTIIEAAARKSKLLTTVTVTTNREYHNIMLNLKQIPNLIWSGHQTTDSWLHLLSQSKFLLGLGNPLLGPSAIDAISHGCVYINPIYDKPVRDIFLSQHPYAKANIGSPFVCSYHIKNLTELENCINHALNINLEHFIPKDFLLHNYLQRVKTIFNL